MRIGTEKEKILLIKPLISTTPVDSKTQEGQFFANVLIGLLCNNLKHATANTDSGAGAYVKYKYCHLCFLSSEIFMIFFLVNDLFKLIGRFITRMTLYGQVFQNLLVKKMKTVPLFKKPRVRFMLQNTRKNLFQQSAGAIFSVRMTYLLV